LHFGEASGPGLADDGTGGLEELDKGTDGEGILAFGDGARGPEEIVVVIGVLNETDDGIDCARVGEFDKSPDKVPANGGLAFCLQGLEKGGDGGWVLNLGEIVGCSPTAVFVGVFQFNEETWFEPKVALTNGLRFVVGGVHESGASR
jgi:hypothetical protein